MIGITRKLALIFVVVALGAASCSSGTEIGNSGITEEATFARLLTLRPWTMGLVAECGFLLRTTTPRLSR